MPLLQASNIIRWKSVYFTTHFVIGQKSLICIIGPGHVSTIAPPNKFCFSAKGWKKIHHTVLRKNKFVCIKTTCLYLLFGTHSRTDKQKHSHQKGTQTTRYWIWSKQDIRSVKDVHQKMGLLPIGYKIQDGYRDPRWINREIEHISMQGGVDKHGNANDGGINLCQ